MYLVDTNIFLETLLDQDKTTEVQSFLRSTDLNIIFMTDFSLYSIGITLFRLKKFALFVSFLEDIVVDGIDILSLNPEDLKTLDQSVQQFSLDFDDAYQYAVAEKHDLQLVSFDRDFDRTERKRKEPAEVLE
jgi:predicted nucleic acid-binding protein